LIEPCVLLRLAGREGSDALDDAECGRGRATLLGEHSIDDLDGLGFAEPAL
jgi:hypothetical protein